MQRNPEPGVDPVLTDAQYQGGLAAVDYTVPTNVWFCLGIIRLSGGCHAGEFSPWLPWRALLVRGQVHRVREAHLHHGVQMWY